MGGVSCAERAGLRCRQRAASRERTWSRQAQLQGGRRQTRRRSLGAGATVLSHFCLTEEVFSSVQLLSRVQLFATSCTAARQASLSIAISQSPPKPMSIKSVMPSNHLILCRPLLLPPSIFPSIRVFSDESVFASGGQSIGVSASASVLPMNIQDRFPLGWTGWISLQSKGLSRVFSNIIVQKHQFFSTQLYLQSNSHSHT